MASVFKNFLKKTYCLAIVVCFFMISFDLNASFNNRSDSRKESLMTSFTCVMNTDKVLHELYNIDSQKAPHPFYKKRAYDPIFPYPDACGSATFLFNHKTGELRYAISYSGLSGRPIMMHFHLGNSKKSGPIIQTIFGDPSRAEIPNLGSSESTPLNGYESPMGRSGFITGVYKLRGNSKLSPPLSKEGEVKALFEGGIYLNIHTYLNEAGEVRGQTSPSYESK